MAHPGTQPLAIIGIGCLFPKANSLDAYWSNIKNRVDAITDVPETHWRPEDYYDRDPAAPDRTYVRRGGFLTPVDFDPMSFGIPPKAIEATDTSQLLGVYVARQTLEDAGYGSGRAFDRSRVSVVLGVTGALELVIPLGARLGHPIWRRALAESGIEGSVADDIVKRISAGYVPWQEDSFPGLLGNVVAGRIANRLDLGGTNCVVDAACASSLSALHLASLELAAGRCDMAICGGVDSFNDIFMFMCFSKTHTLSATGSAKPFDQDADGTIIGEGVGMVAIRRLDDAIADGDHIYAVVRGIGASSDGKGNAVYAPSAEGQMRALRDGYRIAGITPDTIELVEAHGTGTSVGDGVEHAALSQVYRATRRNGRWCALGSVKSQIGHTKAASGAAGLIKAVLALKHKVLPPTINVNRPLPAIASDSSPFYLNIEKRPWVARPDYPRRAAVSSFGFGGSNFHCVLEEHEASKEAIDWDGAVQILAFSAKSSGDLSARLDLTIDDWDDLREKAALSRASFDPADLCRLLIVAERGGTDLQELFTDARKMLSRQPDATSWSTPNGIYFGSGDPDGLLGFLFPGQGSQYVGMLRDLACQFPRMLEILGEADRAFEDQRRGGAELSDLIYPQPAFDEEDRRRDEAALRATEAAQPAIGAVSLGALRILDQFGVRPDAAAGHSYGELTALCAAGRFDAAALHALSNLRGQLMANDNGDAGSMLAVQAPLGKVEEILRESGLELVIANKNAPTQAVLSGSTSQIEKAAEVFGRHQIPSKRLPVAAAFHSPSVAKARKPFEAALEGISFAQARIAVYANTSARVYPENAESARTLLAGQLANPVEFVEEIEEMVRNGVRTFLEVGPGARLSHLVQSILEGQEHHSMALDASGGKRSGIFDLAVVLARIASMGRKVDLGLWDAEFAAAAASGPSSEKPGMTVRIGGANTFVPKPVAARPASEKMPRLPALEKNAALLAASPSSSPSSSSGKEEALKLLHEHMAALQNIQDQTAQLHKQFLDGQDAAQRSIQALVEQQLIMTGGPPSPQPSAAASAPKEPIPIETPIETPIVKTDVGPPPISAPAVTPAPGPPSPQPSAEASAPKPPGGIAEVLLEVVAEKTGYPAEMLELNMDLDADLGIDSIKRVEILSALRERLPEAPSVQPEHLGSLHSLGDIVDFLTEGGPPSLQPSAEASAPRPPVGIAEVLLEVVAEKTGYPAEMLELNMDLDADLGIDSIKRVEILSALREKLPEAPSVQPEHLGSLHSLGDIVDFLTESGPPSPRPSAVDTAASAPRWDQPAEVQGEIDRLVLEPIPLEKDSWRKKISLAAGAMIWVTDDKSRLSSNVVDQLRTLGYQAKLISIQALHETATPAGLAALIILATSAGASDNFIKNAFALLQRAGPHLQATGKAEAAMFVTVSRQDGAFGLRGPGGDPTSGGLAGLSKTASLEWPDVTCKAIDLAFDFRDLQEAASKLVQQMFIRDPLEVGISRTEDCTLRLRPDPLSEPDRTPPLTPGEVVVITGGARGVTADAAVALARAFRPTLLLLGRSPLPSAEPEDLASLVTETDIKKAYLARSKGKASPMELKEATAKLMAGREIKANIARMEKEGSAVLYHSVDVRDPEAVAALIRELRNTTLHGKAFRGVIHGAGVLADRLIEEKTSEQFDRVYDTKVAGLRTLLDVFEKDELRFFGIFSSTTARFGRRGQVDYAVANEVLNKLAQQEARRRPGCRVVSFNWGPWDGGMITPGLRSLFEDEGIALIPLDAGGEYLCKEISSKEGPVEVILLGAGSVEPSLGTPPEPISTPVQRDTRLSMVTEHKLTIDRYPFLRSHVMGGRALLPMSMFAEWLAQAAVHGNPGLMFGGFDDLRIMKGVMLDQASAVKVQIFSGKAVKEGSSFVVPVELRSVMAGREFLNASASIHLVPGLPSAPPALDRTDLATEAYPSSPDEVYSDLLFHGPDFQGIEEIEGSSADGMIARTRTAPAPSQWIAQPLRTAWLTDPLAMDVSFQMMILWCIEHRGAGSLPCFAGRYRQFRTAFPKDGVRIVARVKDVSDPQVRVDFDFLDAEDGVVARLEDFECVTSASLRSAFRRKRLEPHAPNPAPASAEARSLPRSKD